MHFLKLLFLSLILFPALLTPSAMAQIPATDSATIGIGVGQLVQVNDSDVEIGHVISFEENGYHLTKAAYDPAVVGVIVETPAVTLEEKISESDNYMITTGITLVKVTTTNGAIKKGDLLSSSTTPGIAQKATKEGYILGTALESYEGKEIGMIKTSLHFGFNTTAVTLRSNLLSNFNQAIASPFQSPVNSLRYLLAGLVAILALGAGLFFFGKVTSRGIEALGRNPLATTAIIISILINLVLALGIMGVGIGIAYFVLVL